MCNDFLCILRLPADGKGFVVWKERLELSIQACRLYGHLDGATTRPDDPPSSPEGSPVLMAEQVSTVKKYTKDISQYLQEQAIVFQQIASTIPGSLCLKIKGKPTVQEAWDTLKADFERQLCTITVEL